LGIPAGCKSEVAKQLFASGHYFDIEPLKTKLLPKYFKNLHFEGSRNLIFRENKAFQWLLH
jgi:hypothetical protein